MRNRAQQIFAYSGTTRALEDDVVSCAVLEPLETWRCEGGESSNRYNAIVDRCR